MAKKRGWRVLMDRCTRRWFYVRWPTRSSVRDLRGISYPFKFPHYLLCSIEGPPREWKTRDETLECVRKVFEASENHWISTSEPSVILESPDGEREKIWLINDPEELAEIENEIRFLYEDPDDEDDYYQ